MDGMSDALLERMLKDFPALSKEEYAAFERDKTLGGWKMLHYLLFKGVNPLDDRRHALLRALWRFLRRGRVSPHGGGDEHHPRRRWERPSSPIPA